MNQRFGKTYWCHLQSCFGIAATNHKTTIATLCMYTDKAPSQCQGVFTDPVPVNSRACSRIFLAKLVKNCPPPPILSQMNAMQTLPPALTLSYHLRLHNDPFACGLPTEILYAFLMSPMQEKLLLTGMNERGHIIAWHSVPYSEATGFKPLHGQS